LIDIPYLITLYLEMYDDDDDEEEEEEEEIF
jgi:hypothetical protein